MNGVINTNYIPIGSVQTKFTENNQGLKIGKDTFLKMMTMIINSNQGDYSSNQLAEGEAELNIMDMLPDKNIIDFTQFNNVGFDVNEETINSNEVNNEEKKYSETILDDFMIMMNCYNLYNTIGNINIEKVPTKVSTIFEGNSSENLKSSANLTKPQSNSVNIEATDAFIKNNLLQPNYSFEKIIAEMDGQNEKQKGTVDFNLELQMPNENLMYESNKIITVSDESSRIKSQVLSQVKDKIVFISEKGSTSENEIKHVTMELQPHNLGKVDIKITFKDNGMTVEIKALNEETQKILSSNVDELKNILTKSTDSSINVIVKNHEVQYEHQQLGLNQNNDQGYNGNNQNSGHGRQRNFYFEENKNKGSSEDSAFSELINLKNLKLS